MFKKFPIKTHRLYMDASKLAVNNIGPIEYNNCPRRLLMHMTNTISIILFSCAISFLVLISPISVSDAIN